MKLKRLFVFLAAVCAVVCSCGVQNKTRHLAGAQDPVFGEHFTDSTLRLDYVFCGDAQHQAIYLQGMVKTGPWAGRRHNLREPLLRGNGQVLVKDPSSGEVLICSCVAAPNRARSIAWLAAISSAVSATSYRRMAYTSPVQVLILNKFLFRPRE